MPYDPRNTYWMGDDDGGFFDGGGGDDGGGDDDQDGDDQGGDEQDGDDQNGGDQDGDDQDGDDQDGDDQDGDDQEADDQAATGGGDGNGGDDGDGGDDDDGDDDVNEEFSNPDDLPGLDDNTALSASDFPNASEEDFQEDDGAGRRTTTKNRPRIYSAITNTSETRATRSSAPRGFNPIRTSSSRAGSIRSRRGRARPCTCMSAMASFTRSDS